MGKSYGQLENHSADLASEFGLSWATKLFGAEAIASLPVRASGKNKGKPKGYVLWRKCSAAGYCREVQSPLAVGSIADAWIGVGPLSPRSDAVTGNWLGRVQTMAGSSYFLFDEGRERVTAEQRKAREEFETDFDRQANGVVA